jgi:hypothetical protein
MPLRYGNLLRSSSDPIPERLHEIDLLIDREIVEPWRRNGDYLGHGKSSYDREYIVNQRSRKAAKYAPIVAINGSWNLYRLRSHQKMVAWLGPSLHTSNDHSFTVGVP